MVMEGSDVVDATGRTVGVIGGAAEVASGIGTGGVEVGDIGAGGIVSVRSSPCSVCRGIGGATMGRAPGGATMGGAPGDATMGGAPRGTE